MRVLHFKMNPEWQYQRDKVDSAAAELRTENAALRERLNELAREVEAARSRLGGSGNAGGDPTPQADNSAHGSKAGVQSMTSKCNADAMQLYGLARHPLP